MLMAKKKRGGAKVKTKGKDASDNEFFHSHLTKLHNYIKKSKSSGREYKEIKKELQKAGWIEHLIDLTEGSLHQPNEDTLELKQYIIDCLMTGVTKKQIETILLNTGWNKLIVKRLFSEIKKLNHEMIRKERELQLRRDPETIKKKKKKKNFGINIRDIMIHPVITIEPESTITHAARIMSKYSIGCVVVVNPQNKPIGMLTETDILRQVTAKGLDSNEALVADIMSEDLIYASPEMKVIEISTMMREYNIKRLPVIEEGKLIGIITTTQIVQLMAI
jgi:CBS domain-containing protein